jgi:hypothetical protein
MIPIEEFVKLQWYSDNFKGISTTMAVVVNIALVRRVATTAVGLTVSHHGGEICHEALEDREVNGVVIGSKKS